MKYLRKTSVLLVLWFFIFASWGAPMAQAEVEWQTLSTLNLDKKPLDLVSSPKGDLIYVLTEGEVLIYATKSKSIQDRIPVDKGVDRIAVAPRGGELFLTNEKTKTFSVVSVAFVQNIDVKGAPFKGPADAPVVIAVFSDFQ